MTIESNLNLQDASRTRWDVIVVGAGPAGAMVALQLARRGVPVLLIDKVSFPRPKVCGCCLNLRAVAALREAGLGGLASTLGGRVLSEAHLAAANHRARLPLPGGMALSRGALDAALVAEALKNGARFLSPAVAALGPVCGDDRIVRVTRADDTVEVRAAVVIAADGLGAGLTRKEAPSRVDPHSRIGAGAVAAVAPRYYDAGTVFMACGRHGYVGLVRLEDDRLNIAAAFEASFVRSEGGLAHAARTIIHEAGLPEVPDITMLDWHGTPALTRSSRRVCGWRLFVLGDAAGYVEPFTGEGIAWALTCGLALAPLAQRAASAWSSDVEAAWTRRHRELVTRRQGACRALALALRHPMLVRGVVRALARVPQLAQPVVEHLNSDKGAFRAHRRVAAKGAVIP